MPRVGADVDDVEEDGGEEGGETGGGDDWGVGGAEGFDEALFGSSELASSSVFPFLAETEPRAKEAYLLNKLQILQILDLPLNQLEHDTLVHDLLFGQGVEDGGRDRGFPVF